MKKGLFDKRIPTIIALFVLVVIIGISTVLIQSGIFYIGKAAPDTQPLNIQITNVTDKSFTVSFTTTALTDAVLKLQNASTGNTLILDDRDKKSGVQKNYFTHHITAPNLQPSSSYTFALIIGGKNYASAQYIALTGPEITSSPPAQNPLFGKVLLPDGSSGGDTLVIASINDSNTISAVSNENGEFILPTNSLRSSNKASYTVLLPETPITLQFSRQEQRASVNTTFSIAQNLPVITLSEQYAFAKPASPTQESATSELSFAPLSTADTVTITRPEHNEEFVDQRPMFFGTSYPNSSILINVAGVAQQQILTAADGSWKYQTVNNIPPGIHTLTLTTTGSNQDAINLTRKFTILPLGSQIQNQSQQTIAQTAQLTGVPTATPRPPTSTPIPTATPIPPTPTLPISPTVTTTVSPTPSPTLQPSTPTPTLLPTINYTPTPTPKINAPGVIENTAVLTGIAVFLIVGGSILLFLI